VVDCAAPRIASTWAPILNDKRRLKSEETSEEQQLLNNTAVQQSLESWKYRHPQLEESE
jgi:hypothetical protein